MIKFVYDDFCFRKDPLFQGVTLPESPLLKEHVLKKVEPEGKIVYRRGSYSRGVLVLRRGKVKISRRSITGKEQILYIFSRGEILGYRSLLCNEPHTVTATTLDECSFSFIPRQYFLTAVERSHALTRFMLELLGHESTVWMNLLNMTGQMPVKERIIITLLILNEKYKKAGKSAMPSVINLSRENMAAFAGTTVETLVRMLRIIKDEGILTSKGRKIVIHHPEALLGMLQK